MDQPLGIINPLALSASISQRLSTNITSSGFVSLVRHNQCSMIIIMQASWVGGQGASVRDKRSNPKTISSNSGGISSWISLGVSVINLQTWLFYLFSRTAKFYWNMENLSNAMESKGIQNLGLYPYCVYLFHKHYWPNFLPLI